MQSINLHGVGSFYTKKSKRATGDVGIVWSVHFSPSKTWDKMPGYQIDRTVVGGTGSAETLNLAAVAVQVGFPRDLVESGVKDIVNGLTKILKRGSQVNLTMGNMGKLAFQNNDVKFRFFGNFLKTLNEIPDSPKALIRLELEAEIQAQPCRPESAASKYYAAQRELNTPASDKTPTIKSIAPEIENTKGMSRISYVETDRETRNLTFDLEAAAKKLADLEQLIDQTFSCDVRSGKDWNLPIIELTHTHHYSGNRMWKNSKCPICKTEAMKNVVDLEAIKLAEKDNDKMLLHISLGIDQVYFDQKMVLHKIESVGA